MNFYKISIIIKIQDLNKNLRGLIQEGQFGFFVLTSFFVAPSTVTAVSHVCVSHHICDL